ncbi:unnamed protein product [Macrosiphum euphorbiae]|uniref:Nucleic-acid-binding protein from mobile element jockey n=1 Tax=Macrosiphum euphorbiae TaxID=13131 RepID=A0AAV0WJ91_9HEMI|nr:unnamed protein product [Macrosiphum euphorbiae]
MFDFKKETVATTLLEVNVIEDQIKPMNASIILENGNIKHCKNNVYNRNIFNFTKLLNFKIIIERPRTRKARLHPQCKRCQLYGHMFMYCLHTPFCVKCSLDHLISDCSKPSEQPAKFALYLGAHTANFKRYPSYKLFKLSETTTEFQHNAYSKNTSKGSVQRGQRN